jgi:hypothetical protein
LRGAASAAPRMASLPPPPPYRAPCLCPRCVCVCARVCMCTCVCAHLPVSAHCVLNQRQLHAHDPVNPQTRQHLVVLALLARQQHARRASTRSSRGGTHRHGAARAYTRARHGLTPPRACACMLKSCPGMHGSIPVRLCDVRLPRGFQSTLFSVRLHACRACVWWAGQSTSPHLRISPPSPRSASRLHTAQLMKQEQMPTSWSRWIEPLRSRNRTDTRKVCCDRCRFLLHVCIALSLLSYLGRVCTHKRNRGGRCRVILANNVSGPATTTPRHAACLCSMALNLRCRGPSGMATLAGGPRPTHAESWDSHAVLACACSLHGRSAR